MYERQNWVDHVVSPQQIYNVEDNGDGTHTITQAGDVIQEGTPIDQAHLNRMEDGIEGAHQLIEKLNEKVDEGVSGVYTDNGNSFDDAGLNVNPDGGEMATKIDGEGLRLQQKETGQDTFITSAPNFTDEDNPVLKYSNPAGGTLQAGIATTSGTFKVAYRTLTGSSYTFNLTSGERDALRGISTTSNTVSVRFYLKTTIGGQTFTTYSTKTITMKNPAPTLDPVVADVNPTTLALTGDASTLVKGHSNASVTTGAQAVKKATLASQKVTCGKKTLTGNGTIEAVESGSFAFEATDSRGNTTKQTVTKTLIDYFPPTCSIQPGTPDLLGRFTLTAAGVAFAGSFGLCKTQSQSSIAIGPRAQVPGRSGSP